MMVRELARVLVVDDSPASRLTLQTVLRASGYQVETAATAAEAVNKLDESEYELVLSDLQMESPEAGFKVLEHARMMDYKPATAIFTSHYQGREPEPGSSVLISPEDVPELLAGVARLLGQRAQKAVRRLLRASKN